MVAQVNEAETATVTARVADAVPMLHPAATVPSTSTQVDSIRYTVFFDRQEIVCEGEGTASASGTKISATGKQTHRCNDGGAKQRLRGLQRQFSFEEQYQRRCDYADGARRGSTRCQRLANTEGIHHTQRANRHHGRQGVRQLRTLAPSSTTLLHEVSLEVGGDEAGQGQAYAGPA